MKITNKNNYINREDKNDKYLNAINNFKCAQNSNIEKFKKKIHIFSFQTEKVNFAP